jgi:hypothetical protein
MLVENAPNLSRLPSKVIERSSGNEEEEAEKEMPKLKRKFSNSITRHQLASTRCFMVTTAITFVLLTVFLGVDIAFKKNTGTYEKPWFAMSICLISISFVDVLVMAVLNSYVRKDVMCLFRFCCR